MHKIIVLIPTYNECENIEAITRAVMAQPIKNINLLIIDDNSPDGTASMVKKMMPEFPGRLHIIEREGKQGLEIGRASCRERV